MFNRKHEQEIIAGYTGKGFMLPGARAGHSGHRTNMKRPGHNKLGELAKRFKGQESDCEKKGECGRNKEKRGAS
ncbi:hypothetical protein XELAEV_18035903mg [Xenopus laevis]|uniref:Uncharacterized protein n=1 Tax=Xenopus laevis TaxID=8355 RepID=A0A974CHQ6_XENLA|nr:hypothetical protein XELAEV_18035903mg [Xenopus laevis]